MTTQGGVARFVGYVLCAMVLVVSTWDRGTSRGILSNGSIQVIPLTAPCVKYVLHRLIPGDRCLRGARPMPEFLLEVP